MRTLIIDHYDSFTFNLYQALACVNGCEPWVVQHDQVTLADVLGMTIDNIVISPGPGRPERGRDFGICAEVLRQAQVPVLGVCLGCQGLGWVYGAAVIAAPEPMHGRMSAIMHDDADLFAGISQGFMAVRYHSLIVSPVLPPALRRIAWTADGVIMGLRHATKPIWGVQFHPESIGTEHGLAILKNFCAATERLRGVCTQRPDRAGRRQAHHAIEATTQAHWRRLKISVTAEDVFHDLYGGARHAFWLDSSLTGEERGRFSFMGVAETARDVWHYDVERRRLTTGDGAVIGRGDTDFFQALKEALAARRCAACDLPFDFRGGMVGYLGYEMKADCGSPGRHRSAHPDAAFIMAQRYLAFDHVEGSVYLVCVGSEAERVAAEAWMDSTERRLVAVRGVEPVAGASELAPHPPRLARAAARYLEDVRECQRLIAEGESYEICLTNRVHVAGKIDALRLHGILRRRNPAPYAAYLRFGDMAVVSSSPECFLRIDRDRNVETRPIKGTMRRGANAVEDEVLREALRNSVKNRAENLMIVDLMRNDLGRVCEPGTVAVSRLMEIESYATVHQMVSTVRGRLRSEVDAVDCIRQAFPAGSMTGAPKLRTLEILDRLETEARGVYSGAIGYLGFDGAADFSVVIRTAVVDGEQAVIGTGGAVVALSRPEEEFAEIGLKAEVLLRAIGELTIDE